MTILNPTRKFSGGYVDVASLA